MKLYFVTNEYYDGKSGVENKIDDQLLAFKKFSFDTELITDTHDNIIKKNLNIVKKIPSDRNQVYFFRSVSIFTPLFMRKIKRLSKHNFLILELPTPLKSVEKEFNKEKDGLLKFYVKKLLFSYSFPRVLKYFDLILEYDTESDKFANNIREKIEYINNGINVEKIKKSKVNDNEDNLHFISVANNSRWHGYDRFIRGLYNFYNDKPEKKVFYHCVGNGPELSNLKKLVKELNLENYVFFYGSKTGNDLDQIFDKADLALGSLANHRKNMFKDSALKNREYCARGIPFIIASDDDDFDKSFKYAYQITKDEKPVNVFEMIDFYERIKNEGFREKMREYSERKLSWEKKLNIVKKRLNCQ